MLTLLNLCQHLQVVGLNDIYILPNRHVHLTHIPLPEVHTGINLLQQGSSPQLLHSLPWFDHWLITPVSRTSFRQVACPCCYSMSMQHANKAKYILQNPPDSPIQVLFHPLRESSLHLCSCLQIDDLDRFVSTTQVSFDYRAHTHTRLLGHVRQYIVLKERYFLHFLSMSPQHGL